MQRDAGNSGLLEFLHVEIKWLLKRFLDFKLVWVNRRELGPATSAPEAVRTEIASYQTLEPCLGIPEYHLREEVVSGHFARGDVCVATFLGDQLASYSWVRYRPVEAPGKAWPEFGPEHRYTVWGFTHPDFRGRHIRGSFGALDALDRKHAVTHSINYIDTHNFSSLKAEARHGGETVGLAGYFRLFGRIVTFRSPGAKKYGFRFCHSASA